MIELKPIRDTPEQWDGIEASISKLFLDEIYRPLMKELGVNSVTLKNTQNKLIEAIRSGRLTYNKGKFSGKLNATLSKELRELGAHWDRTLKCYSIPIKDLPYEIRNVISVSESKFVEVLANIDKKLAAIIPDALADKINISKFFDRSLYKIEKQFKESVKNFTITPTITQQQRIRIATEYQDDLKRPISDFTQEEIQKLRKQVRESVLAGNRYESLKSSIQASYQVSQNKAKFLARQETNLMMAKYTETKYQQAGIEEYKWRSVVGSKLHPVRPTHKALNDASNSGNIFRFDDPPITSEPGEAVRRNNPKQDFNCRCVAIPVVRFKK